MPLAAGDQLASYEIISLIGAGGMGEVYRARDPRVGRDVAIKISAERFSERFEREARVIASLNHPNICTLYDVGPNYLVMELVEGEPPRGPMPMEEALAVAQQIAAALEAAHEKGVTHRDLKPANILVRPDGTVKVLDFGLAKVDAAPAVPSNDSPTISLAATQSGLILGTAAYMSPEQARGRPADHRADIWAFGVVLHEMLTGNPLFQGEDISETLASVIKDEPELGQIPAPVRRLLKACLQKDPKRRLQHIGDMRLLLENAATPVVSPGLPPRRSWLAWSVAAAGLLIAVGVSLVYFRATAPAPLPVRFPIFPPEDVTIVAGSVPLISPDGRQLLFIAAGTDQKRRLWLHSMNSPDCQPLAGTEEAFTPFWSQDSRWIGFFASGRLKKIAASGGPVQTIAETPPARFGNVIGAWNRDGVIIFASQEGLMRVPDSGGPATRLTALDASRGESQHTSPELLPDGRHFLYARLSKSAENTGIYVGSLDDSPGSHTSPRLLAGVSRVTYAPASNGTVGHLVFIQEGTLFAQPFDPRKLQSEGAAIPIAEGISDAGTTGFFSASANDVLVYRRNRGAVDSQLTWFDRNGKILGVALKPGIREVVLSPQGDQVAGGRYSGSNAARAPLTLGFRPSWTADIWKGEFERGTSMRLTSHPAGEGMPVWSPDGKQIVFASNRDGPLNLFLKTAGAETEEPVLVSPENKIPWDWSRDGHFLLYSSADPKTGEDLWVLPLKIDGTRAGDPAVFLKTQFNEGYARFSPDRRWIAYRSNASGQDEIYVRPFPATPDRKELFQVSTNGGSAPHWRRDGREIFYLEPPNGYVVSAEVTTSPEFKVRGVPKRLFNPPIYAGSQNVESWDVTPDGQRFLIDTNVDAARDPGAITVLLNWQSALKK